MLFLPSQSRFGNEWCSWVTSHRPSCLRRPSGEPQPIGRIARQLLRHAASQQRPDEGDVVAGRDLELGDLERGALPLPLEERRPQVPVGGEPSDTLVRRWHVEHDDVVRVILDDRVEIAGVDRIGPPPDQRLNLLRLHLPRCCHRVVSLLR